MNLAEELNRQRKRGAGCRWQHWWNNIPQTDRDSITTAFDNHDIETSHIVRTLHAYGCPMSESTIRTHRRRECKTCNS